MIGWIGLWFCPDNKTVSIFNQGSMECGYVCFPVIEKFKCYFNASRLLEYGIGIAREK